jgi:hypothetical protein
MRRSELSEDHGLDHLAREASLMAKCREDRRVVKVACPAVE